MPEKKKRKKSGANDLQSIVARYQKSVYFEYYKISHVDSRGLDGQPLLHVVISMNDNDALKGLLKAGANPNILGDMSYTPLHEAVYYGNGDAVTLLLKFGADRSLKSEFGQTAFDLATKRGKPELLPFLDPSPHSE